MRTYTDQEFLDGEDLNYISRRLVNTYASASERSTLIPTPAAGQLAWVTGVGLTLYTGTAWVPVLGTSGTATLVGGTVTVNTTTVTATSRIRLTAQNLGTVTVPSALAVSARTPGSSFTILASQATDTSDVAWHIEP